MTEFRPHQCQRDCIEFFEQTPKCGGFLPMGAGKTVSTLTYIANRMYLDFTRVLIIGPKRVVESTWPDEIEKWSHVNWLSYHVISAKQAKGNEEIPQDMDIYLVSKENITALCALYRRNWPFDLVVIDELSTFKNPQSQRFKALKKMMPKTDRFIGLTGTPAPKGLPDLWAQLYLMDNGERLGRTLTEFRRKFLKPGRGNGCVIYEWELQDGADKRIYNAISDICLSIQPGDCAKLPPLNQIEYKVKMSDKEKKAYKNFERNYVLNLPDDTEVTAASAAALTNKLSQFSSGAIYDEKKNWKPVHARKLDALEDLLTAANGQPVLVFYYFKHEKERIEERFGKAYTISGLDSPDDLKRWNAGEIDLLLVHPASAGHGLNLQEGGSIIVWFSLPNWDLELYQQANARLYRQGQKKPVTIYHLLTAGTVDQRMLRVLQGKGETQSQLIAALRKEHKDDAGISERAGE